MFEAVQVNLRKPIKIGTWNTRSLFEAEKLANISQEMNRIELDILEVAEICWPGTEKCNPESGTFFCNEDRNHRKGVGIIITKNLLKYVREFVLKSDRAVLVKLKAKPNNLNIIQVYGPTRDGTDKELEQFYSEIKLTRKHDVNIIMGDFNAKIGKSKFGEIIGPYGIEIRKEKGDRLLQFCQEENISITNTWFHLPPRRLYTWKSPTDRYEQQKTSR